MVSDIGQRTSWIDDYVVFPLRPRANQLAAYRLGLADVLNRVGAGPNGAARDRARIERVVAPAQALGIKKVSQRGVVEARILGARFRASRIDEADKLRGGSGAAGVV